MNYSYRPVLQEKVIKERKEQAEQEALRRKYKITGNKVIQIKKEHLVTSVAKVFGRIVRKLFMAVLLILAFNGAVAFLHPDSRAALVYVYTQAIYQAGELCPPLMELISK